MFKKKILSLLLTASMAATPIVSSAAELNNVDNSNQTGTEQNVEQVNVEKTSAEETAATDNVVTETAEAVKVKAEAVNTQVLQAGEVVYVDENFEDTSAYPDGLLIKSANQGEDSVTPVVKNGITFNAGQRGNGVMDCSITVGSVGESRGLIISEDGFATSSRGVSFVFNSEDIPKISELNSNEMLELNMDFTSTQAIGITGFTTIQIPDGMPTDGLAHLRILFRTDYQVIVITDSEGNVIYVNKAVTPSVIGIQGVTFYEANTKAKLDNIRFEKKAAEDFVIQNAPIFQVNDLEQVAVNAADYENYKHPTTASVVLQDGTSIDVDINADSWTCEPAFDANKTDLYTWTADIIAPAEHANPNGLKVKYNMAYTAATTSTHDYENGFNFDADLTGFSAFGKEMDSVSGTGGFSTSIATADGARYVNASVTGNGNRGSKLTISSDIVKGSEVNFDWMPVNSNGSGNGEILFAAPGKYHSYFALRFDTSYNLVYYTANALPNSSTTQNTFDGVIAAADAVSTGLNGNNKWYNVNIKFDYIKHTADITITDKTDTSKTYTATDIPIEAEANGLQYFVVHMNKINNGASVAMGLDNLVIDNNEFGAEDIVDITQLSNINLARTAYKDYTFPEEVTVTLGDNSKKNIKVKSWTSEPGFDTVTPGTYTWTADLETEGLSNYFGLKATFTMHYTELPYPVYVYAPATRELEFGEDLDVSTLPKTVKGLMSDGSLKDLTVDEWVPIRAFDKDNSGIYIYAAMIKPIAGEYEVDDSLITPNEHPAKSDGTYEEKYKNELKEAGINYDDYQVYYRVTNYKSNDNYNGYARSMGYVDRGVYAIQVSNEGELEVNQRDYEGIFVSWRLMPDEYGKDVKFYVLRNGERINKEPITDVSYYVDKNGKAGDKYSVITTVDGVRYDSNEFTALDKNYFSIKLQRPAAEPNVNGVYAEYTLNDAGFADVDGDGEYEFIVKWYPTNAFDSGKVRSDGGSSSAIFDLYKMDGTALWRLYGGLELPCGAHFNQFILYDLDEDGNAELFFKTSDGTKTYQPNDDGLFDMTDNTTLVSYIGDRSVVPGEHLNSNGHMLPTTNEYVTVFNGVTGDEIDTIPYVNQLKAYEDYGDSYGNRASRFNMAIAYLPKDKDDPNCTETIPAVIFQRGYYQKSTCAAYTLKNGKLNLEWNFDAPTSADDGYGKGNHNIAVGDVDNDGFDEIVFGALALDHDGSLLWSKTGKDGQDFCGHADSIHLAAMFPDSNQLYIYEPQEETNASINDSLTNAGTGARIVSQWAAPADIGRAVAANITSNPGYELWANQPNSELGEVSATGPIYNVYGDIITTTKPKNFTTNWSLYWDGDLLNELPDSYKPNIGEGHVVVWKYNENDNTVNNIAEFEGTKLNNSTKNTAAFTGDILGDWRDEIVVRDEENSELRIYMTDYETDYMIYSLMYDPVYRGGVTYQNTSYNQPAHLGFYLGEDIKDKVLNMELPVAKINYTNTAVKENAKSTEPIPEYNGSEDVETFSDVTDVNAYYYNAVNFVYSRSYMVGKSVNEDGSRIFDPNGVITRAEFAQILYSIEKKPTVEYSDVFTDVEKDKWYTDAIMWAKAEGVVAGKGDVFDVAGQLTREEMTTMLYAYAKYKGYDVSAEYELTDYTDVEKISSWAESGIKWSVKNGLVTGKIVSEKKVIDPKATATRAETSVIINNFVKNIAEAK